MLDDTTLRVLPQVDILDIEAPVVAACLSPLGLRVEAPAGIPTQAREAAGCAHNATLGQVTDGRGGAQPIDALAEAAGALDPQLATLYSPPGGHPAMIEAWGARQAAEGEGRPSGRPIVVHGLTQGLAIAADLFCDSETDVILPDLGWDNYPALFSLRSQARLIRYPFYADGRFNRAGLADALRRARRKAVVILNFPHNPTGYVPSAEEARQIVRTLNAAPVPVVAVVDDAYLGLVYDGDRPTRSLYWDLVDGADPDRVFAFRVDGATKSLGFFGGRVGFVSFSLPRAAEQILSDKIRALICAGTLCPPGPSQAILLGALADPNLERDRRRMVEVLARRHEALRAALARHAHPACEVLPGHGGAFVTVRLADEIDADQLRRDLLDEHGVGLVALPASNCLRIAFCSATEADLTFIAQAIESSLAARARPLAVGA